jgi:hypothetical protein
MAIIKVVNSRASIGNACNYITKDEKTGERLISGIDCTPETAIEDMKATKGAWGKTDGRQYKHYIQSFPPGTDITPQQAHDMAREFSEKQFEGYEVLIATHRDKDHIHSHMIVNSVSHENGLKYQESSKDLQALKDFSNEQSRVRGLPVPEKGGEVTAYTKGKYKVLEKGITGKYKSYVVDCYRAADTARQMATSRGDFIQQMKEAGWETSWADSRKHITFTDGNGNKVRARNLEKTFKEPFGKEELERGFEIDFERANGNVAADWRRRIVAGDELESGKRGSQTGDTDAAIAKLDAAIGKSKAAVTADDRQRADRIADEQSRQRKSNRVAEQRTLEKSPRSQSRGR